MVLPIHVHDVFSPAIYAFARVLSEATVRLSDDELAVVVSNMPNVPSDVASVRRFAAEIASGRPPQQVVREEDLIQSAARWIAELSAKAPVVLVVDDLDTAGYALLHVIWQLAVVDTPKRVLVIGSARPDRMPMSPLAQTLRVLDRHKLLRRISMPELGMREIQELLDRMHVERFADLAEPLHELTGGNAFLLAETLSMGSPEEVVERWTVPPQLRDVMQQRVSELGRATTELLMIACLFSRDFSIEVLADATGASAATVASLIDRAVAAHVLQPSTLRTYRFAHQLFRHALVASQPASARAAGHRQIALALERADATPSGSRCTGTRARVPMCRPRSRTTRAPRVVTRCGSTSPTMPSRGSSSRSSTSPSPSGVEAWRSSPKRSSSWATRAGTRTCRKRRRSRSLSTTTI